MRQILTPENQAKKDRGECYEFTAKGPGSYLSFSYYAYSEKDIMANMLHNVDGQVLAMTLMKMGITPEALRNPKAFKLVSKEPE